MVIFRLLLVALVFASPLLNVEGAAPAYSELQEVLPLHEHGWFGEGNQKQLACLLKEHEIKTIVELGSWLGKSSIWLAQRLPDDGMLYCVDTWKGSIEHQKNPLLATLYEQFLSNVIHFGLQEKIYPLRMTTLEAAQNLPEGIQPDLIYVDASHETQDVYNDLAAWYPYVKENGILCGDDWRWLSVRCAVKNFAEENDLEIHTNGNFWYYTRR